jgi:L-arabinokinase
MTSTVGRASGRLDLLGGVADYSGARVLEVATQLRTTVVAEADDALVAGPARFGVDEVTELARLPYEELRAALVGLPRWTHYVLGVAFVLVRHGIIDPPRARLTIDSDVPTAVGVSSSAALEIATARALVVERVEPLHVATLCQEAENHVVGAPCGIMDQVVVAMGRAGAVLPILCRPAAVEAIVDVPDGLEVVGVPTGAEHDVSGVPYRRARAAAFMGQRIVEDARGCTYTWVSELPADAVASLPDELDGATFLDRWRTTADALTTVDPDETYPVRAATAFGGEEHRRSDALLAALARHDTIAISRCMRASHAGYDAMGLGHPAAGSTAARVLDRRGVHGARSSGGGSGGTVVVVCDRGALDDIDDLIR